ncbi:MAG: leucine-rich repeat protein, partial [Ruminococcus sp.]|nr:leucine-rich repeat protein [Ruminococcus sp.]
VEENFNWVTNKYFTGAQIPHGCFENCTSLTEIVFPENIEYIGMEAFKNCKSLKNVVIPEGVKYISSAAFMGCDSLETVTLPSTIEIAQSCVSVNPDTNAYSTVILTTNNEYIENKINKLIEQGKNISPPIIVHPTVVVAGDINGDTVFNVNDATTLQMCLAERYTFDISSKGDYDRDGRITISDVTCMLLVLANKVSPPDLE